MPVYHRLLAERRPIARLFAGGTAQLRVERWWIRDERWRAGALGQNCHLLI